MSGGVVRTSAKRLSRKAWYWRFGLAPYAFSSGYARTRRGAERAFRKATR